MEEPHPVNSNAICRLCLCEDECNMLPIFDASYTFLPQRIAACVNVEVSEYIYSTYNCSIFLVEVMLKKLG